MKCGKNDGRREMHGWCINPDSSFNCDILKQPFCSIVSSTLDEELGAKYKTKF